LVPVPSGRGGLLTVMGAVNWDTTLFASRLGGPGEEVPVSRAEEGPGGKGANAAVAGARILGRGKVAFIGALGDDGLGTKLRVALRDEGVLVRGLVVHKGVESGRAFILVDRMGRKSIHTLFGANDTLRPADLDSDGGAAALSSASTLIIMDVPLGAAIAAARRTSKGAHVICSPGVRSARGLRALRGILGLADEVVLNKSELLQLCSTRNAEGAVRRLRESFPQLRVVTTLGRSGCMVTSGNSTIRVPGVNLGRLGLQAVNSTGSGDAFLAAYACYIMRGLAPPNAAAWGNLAGALKATSTETRGSPDREKLESVMLRLNGVRGRRPG
jgi:ribokinase